MLAVSTAPASFAGSHTLPNFAEHRTVLQDAYATSKLHAPDGSTVRLHSHIDQAEGMFLYRLASQPNITRSLEIGMAYGIATLFIA